MPELKVGQKVRWESADGRRFEGTVVLINKYGIETTQDSPPDDRRWFHGSKAPLEPCDTPPAIGHPGGVQLGGFAPAGPDDRPLPAGPMGEGR